MHDTDRSAAVPVVHGPKPATAALPSVKRCQARGRSIAAAVDPRGRAMDGKTVRIDERSGKWATLLERPKR
ncbi:MAG: hypothetical protein ACREA0_34045, partial [bacterium]